MKKNEIQREKEQIIKELALVAFANVPEIFDLIATGGPEHLKEWQNRAFCSVSVSESGTGKTIEVSIDKVAALRLLGEHIGMFSEKQRGSHSQNESVTT